MYEAWLLRDTGDMGGTAVFVKVASFLAEAAAVQQYAPLYFMAVLVAPSAVVIVGAVSRYACLMHEFLALDDLLVGEEG